LADNSKAIARKIPSATQANDSSSDDPSPYDEKKKRKEKKKKTKIHSN